MGAHFTEAGLKFLRGIKRNNDREWFNARKDVYEQELKAPMLAVIGEVNEVLADVAPEFVRDPAKIMMRIYRDTRFSKDKLPYKTQVAAWWARAGLEKTSGGGFYMHVSPTEVTIAAGCYMPEREQLLAIRRHLLEKHEEYRAFVEDKRLERVGMREIERAMMTRPPKGFAADHPAIDLIMQRQWGVGAALPPEAALRPDFPVAVSRRFKLALPLVSLLNGSLALAPKKALY